MSRFDIESELAIQNEIARRWGVGYGKKSLNKADANLLKAAPDMLAALKDVLSALEHLGEDGWSDAPYLMRTIRAAIAKAGG